MALISKLPMAVQIFWCRWWPTNQLSIRPNDQPLVPEGVCLSASSYNPDNDEDGEGVNVFLDTNAVIAVHALLGEWLSRRAWPTEAKIHNEQLPISIHNRDDYDEDER